MQTVLKHGTTFSFSEKIKLVDDDLTFEQMIKISVKKKFEL